MVFACWNGLLALSLKESRFRYCVGTKRKARKSIGENEERDGVSWKLRRPALST